MFKELKTPEGARIYRDVQNGTWAQETEKAIRDSGRPPGLLFGVCFALCAPQGPSLFCPVPHLVAPPQLPEPAAALLPEICSGPAALHSDCPDGLPPQPAVQSAACCQAPETAAPN